MHRLLSPSPNTTHLRMPGRLRRRCNRTAGQENGADDCTFQPWLWPRNLLRAALLARHVREEVRFFLSLVVFSFFFRRFRNVSAIPLAFGSVTRRRVARLRRSSFRGSRGHLGVAGELVV